MHTKSDISQELEQRVKEAHAQLVASLQPRDEIRLQKMGRFEEIRNLYDAIIRELPMNQEDKHRLFAGIGGVYFFKDDYKNAKTLLEIAFGFGVARGAARLFKPEVNQTAEKYREEALVILPAHTDYFRIPPRAEITPVYNYGQLLGYERGKVAEVEAMIEAIKSLEPQTNIVKYTQLPEARAEQPTKTAQYQNPSHYRGRRPQRRDIY